MKDNIKAIRSRIALSNNLPHDPSPDLKLRNTFSGVTTTQQQEHDLLEFRSIGQNDSDAFVSNTYLKHRAIKTKRHNLRTFSQMKVIKKLLNQMHKEKDMVATCLRKRLMWLQMTEEEMEGSNEQYLELPRAIADPSGKPHKGQKSNTTKSYESKFTDAVATSFPYGWLPDSVIMEGMFMINATPIRVHSKMIEYVHYLLQQFLGWYLQVGVQEVHVVFDCPGKFKEHPKSIERQQ